MTGRQRSATAHGGGFGGSRAQTPAHWPGTGFGFTSDSDDEQVIVRPQTAMQLNNVDIPRRVTPRTSAPNQQRGDTTASATVNVRSEFGDSRAQTPRESAFGGTASYSHGFGSRMQKNGGSTSLVTTDGDARSASAITRTQNTLSRAMTTDDDDDTQFDRLPTAIGYRAQSPVRKGFKTITNEKLFHRGEGGGFGDSPSDFTTHKTFASFKRTPSAPTNQSDIGESTGFAAASGFGESRKTALDASSGFGEPRNSGFGTSSAFGNNTGFGTTFGFGGAAGGGDSSSCYSRDKPGHRRAERSEQPKPRDGNCYNCGEFGHISTNCSQSRQSRGAGQSNGPVCFNCGKQGHFSARCKGAGEYPQRENTGPRRPSYRPPIIQPEELFETEVRTKVGSHFEDFYHSETSISRNGREIPHRFLDNFDQLGLHSQVKRNILRMNYKKPTPIQHAATIYINRGDDVMACAQTGSGKTAAFLLPILNRIITNEEYVAEAGSSAKPLCIVVEPTRELASQTYDAARMYANKTGLPICSVYGGVRRREQLMEMMAGCAVLVATMGRLLDYIAMGDIVLEKTKYLVLDEADRMLDQGFQPDIANLLSHESWLDKKSSRQTIMFSATFPDAVQELARTYLKSGYTFVVVDRLGSANKCVRQQFIKVEFDAKRDALLELLGVDKNTLTLPSEDRVLREKTLIFVDTRSAALQLAAFLADTGIPTTSMHSDRTQEDREESLRGLKRGTFAIMVATGVAERGLDVQGIDHVINYDLPESIDDYVHRIGRSGRVGYEGRSTTFIDPRGRRERFIIGPLIEILQEAGQEVPDFVRELAPAG